MSLVSNARAAIQRQINHENNVGGRSNQARPNRLRMKANRNTMKLAHDQIKREMNNDHRIGRSDLTTTGYGRRKKRVVRKKPAKKRVAKKKAKKKN